MGPSGGCTQGCLLSLLSHTEWLGIGQNHRWDCFTHLSHLSQQAPWAYQERSWRSTLAVQQGQTSTSRPGISSSPIKMTQTKPCHLWCRSLPTRRTSRFRYLSRIRVSCSIWYVSFLIYFSKDLDSIKGKICDSINLSKEIYQTFLPAGYLKEEAERLALPHFTPDMVEVLTRIITRPKSLAFRRSVLTTRERRRLACCKLSKQGELVFIRSKHEIWHAFYTQRQVVCNYLTDPL